MADGFNVDAARERRRNVGRKLGQKLRQAGLGPVVVWFLEVVGTLAVVFRLFAKAVVWIGLAAVLIWAPFGIYEWADSNGYVPHSVEATISVQQNWIVGETKRCSSVPLDDKTARLWKEKVGFVAAPISCDGGPYHTMQVKLYGRTEQPEHKAVTWRCTRGTESFTCWQTGAE